MPVSTPLLSLYQAVTQAAMDKRDPSTDPQVQDAIAKAKADGYSDADINTYYQSGVTAPSRTQGGNGFFASIQNSVPLIESVASYLVPGAAPIIAGYNAAQSIASGKPITVGTVLNAATALSGLSPGSDILNTVSDATGIDASTLKSAASTANSALGAANAIKTGNLAGLVSSIAQVAGASTDVKSALSAMNAVTALNKGDIAGALSAINSITNSVDPKLANLAKTAINAVDPSLLAVPSTANVSSTTSTANVDSTDTTAASTPTAVASTPATANVGSTPAVNPLATPTGPTSQTQTAPTNPLAVPNMPAVKPPSATIGKMNEIDLAKLFDQVNSLNPVQDNTISARSGGSIDDLVQLLNSRG